MEAIKKTQTVGRMERKILGIVTGTTEASFTNRLKEMKERISGFEDTKKEMDISAKEVNSQMFLT